MHPSIIILLVFSVLKELKVLKLAISATVFAHRLVGSDLLVNLVGSSFNYKQHISCAHISQRLSCKKEKV